jgi:hypothetical protein
LHVRWNVLGERVRSGLLAFWAFQPRLGHLVSRKPLSARRILPDSTRQVDFEKALTSPQRWRYSRYSVCADHETHTH